MDNHKTIYRMLRYLEKAMDYDEPDMDMISAEALGISEQRWQRIIEMLIDDGFIKGMSLTVGCDGYAVLSLSSPRITRAGLDYLEENSFMKEAANIAKGIAEIIP